MQQLRDVMSRDVQVMNPEGTLMEAAQHMRKGNFGMMPVGEKDRMIGTISDRDIAIRGMAEGKDSGTKVRDIMSEGVIWAYENDSVDDAVKLMCEHQVRRLPIVNAEKRLVGIVALADFAVERADLKAAGEALAEISKP